MPSISLMAAQMESCASRITFSKRARMLQGGSGVGQRERHAHRSGLGQCRVAVVQGSARDMHTGRAFESMEGGSGAGEGEGEFWHQGTKVPF